jgi:hypothetical protein
MIHDEEASAEQLIHAALQIARRSIPGDSSPQPEKEASPEASHRDAAMSRVIELAGGRIGIDDENASQKLFNNATSFRDVTLVV